MKKTKRIFALLLAVVMSMAMAVTTFAGTITIENVADGETYTAYKIFDVTTDSYTDKDGNKITTYKYTITSSSEWYSVVNSDDGEEYFVLTKLSTENDVTTYVVTLVGETDAESIATFLAKYTVLYNGNITGEEMTVSGGTATLTNCDNGYYLVTSTLGTNLMLDTVADGWDIKSKNTEPSVEKKIVDDEIEYDEKSYSVGDTVSFEITVTAGEGAVKYVVTDTMSDGLTYVGDSLKVTINEEELTVNEDYTLSVEDQVITVTFTSDCLDALEGNEKIVISYSATLSESAVIGENGNSNSVELSYGNNSSVTDEVVVYTYSVSLKKVSESGDELSGAVFELTNSSSNTLYFSTSDEYLVNTSIRSGTDGYTDEIVIGSGTIKGLGAGTYYLKETSAPDGYNILGSKIKITITDGGEITFEYDGETASYANGVLTIVNASGNELPSTGGVGTKILYIAGIALVLIAGIALITRRRMNREA